jgi:mRNA interferase MazF
MKRFELYLVNLEPAIGVEMKKTRPCLIVSPDEMNNNVQSVIVSPLTTNFRNLPSRIKLEASNSNGLSETSYVALDQIKTVDKNRCIKRIGMISVADAIRIADLLVEIFKY